MDALSKISRLKLASVSEQTGLSLTWMHTSEEDAETAENKDGTTAQNMDWTFSMNVTLYI